MDKSELMLHSHSDIQELIRFIDQKTGALLVIYGFFLTATLDTAKDLKIINPFELDNNWDTFLSILLFLVGLLLLALIIFQVYFLLFRIIKPRKAANYTQEEVSVLYFGHISACSRYQFITNFMSASTEEIEKQMLEQIHEISCVLSEKTANFNFILKYLFYTIVCLLLFIYLSRTV